MLHVERFCSTITERGRSKIIEDYDAKTIEVGEALLILISVERQDEFNQDLTSEKAVDEISKLANKLKVKVIALHPFAHLFADMSSPEVALEVIKLTAIGLNRNGFKVVRTPFGWFNTLELKAKGHPLSRVARIIN